MPESTPQNNATLRKTRCRTTQTPRTTSAGCPSFAFGRSGRSGEIRTRGLTVPNRTRYQTALHPDKISNCLRRPPESAVRLRLAERRARQMHAEGPPSKALSHPSCGDMILAVPSEIVKKMGCRESQITLPKTQRRRVYRLLLPRTAFFREKVRRPRATGT